MYLWLLAAHLIGLFLWLGGLFAVYWLLRIHVHAPKEAHEKLVLMERSLALMMDIASALAIGAGIALLFESPRMVAWQKQGWFHAKLALVILGVLPVHGIIRGRIKKFSQGTIKAIPDAMWSLLLVAMCGIVILVCRRPWM